MKKLTAVIVILAGIVGIAALAGLFSGGTKDYREMVELGIMYQDKGETGKALKLFRGAVRAEPKDPQAHFFLGRLYFMMRKEDDAIREFASFMESMKALQQGAAIDTKGYIQYLNAIITICDDLKQYGMMKDAIDEVMALDPKDQNAYYNLGIYYYNAEHDRPKAYRNFRKAADLGPNTGLGKKARYAIEFMRNNPDSRIAPDLSFIDQEYR